MLLCGQSDVFSGSGGGGAENNSSYRFNCVDRDTKAELLPREDSTFKDSGLSQSRLLSVPEGRSGVVRSAGNSVDHSFVDGQRPSSDRSSLDGHSSVGDRTSGISNIISCW